MSEKKIKLHGQSKNKYAVLYRDEPNENKGKKIKLHSYQKSGSIPGIAYFGGKLATGALGIVEGTTDLIAGGLADLFGNDEYADYVFQHDNWVQDLNQKLDEAYNPGKVGRFVGDVASGLGQSATFLIPGAGQVLFFTGVTGNAVSSASQTTGKTGLREYAYGAMSGTLEAILERYIAGTGQTLETITKSGAKNIASKVVKSYGKAAAKTTTKKMVAAQLISSAVGEGLEEFAGNIGDVGLRRLTGVDKEASINWSDAFYETVVGMASGTLMGGVSTSVQTAYEAKNGAQINSDAKRRDTMLTQARGIVKMAKEQSLDKGSDAVAARLSEIEASLTAYDNAKDKSGGAANIALGKINQALIGAELNIITDRHAEYIASLSDTEREQLAEYANAYFKDAGVEVTAKDLKDINNQITRALATLDWAGKIVNTMIGTDRILNEEVLAKMEAQQVSEEERAAYQNEQNAKAELERVKTEASENAKPITEGATWNGEAASYHGYLNGAETTLHIEKRNDGAYQAFFITEDNVRPVKLTEEQVKAALAKMTDTENRAEENKSSEGEGDVTKEEKQPETKENEGESGTKLSLEESFASRIDSWDKKTEGFSFVVGQTSSVLQQIEVGGKKIGKKQIRIDASKIKKILSDHKEMTIEIFKKIPKVLENPILVLESKTVSGRIVLFGELYDDRGRLIQIVMELNPSTKSGKSTYLDVVKIASAYAKANAQNLINTSKILYVDKNRSRVKDWLKVNRLQLPLPSSQSDSASEDSISHSPEKSNTSEENSPKSSLGADSIPENETAKAKKPSEEYTETAFKATPEEVKAAMKAVKQFKLLDAETREAIIQMMRSASGIDKVTVQSIAVFMSVRSGLQVRFMKDHRAEGSYDVLTKSGRRLILLDPSKMNGKHWRADIFFHELYHDMATTGDLKGLTKAIYDTAAPSFQHAVADLYTAYYNKGVSISKFLDGKKWTEKNIEAYFKEHDGVSFDDVMEEVAAGTMGRVMGSKKFIRSLRQVGILKRVYYNIAELVQSIANRSITVGGDNTAGFTLTFRDALGYKALYSRAVIESEADLSPEAIAELRRVIEEAAERDEDRARTKMSLDTNRQVYNGIREAFAKKELDRLSIKLGDRFPLSRNFDETMRNDKTPLALETVNNNTTVKDPDKSYYVAGKKAFRSTFGGTKTTVHIAQLDTDVELYQNITDESLSKADNNKNRQTLIDVIPNIERILKKSVCMSIERVLHTDNKSAPLLAYRLYNLYWYTEGNKKNLHCLVCTIVQNTNNTEGYIFKDIENVTINRSLPGNKADMSPTVDDDNYNISQLYRFVKTLSRKDGGIKYSQEDRTKYAFTYSARNDGTKYSLSLDADYLDAVSRGDMDTAQKMVDEAARKAMPNSLVRDATGKLLKVYHGSPSKFTIFKHSKINAHGNMHGRGFYFTDYKSLAEGYQKDGGQLLEGYLNIEKPLSEEKITIKKTDLLKLIKATCEAEAKQLVEDGSHENIRDALPDTWISNYVMTYRMNINTAYREVADIIYSGSDNDVDMLAEITNASGGSETALTLTHDLLGYDGVIFENDERHHEYVMLISNQFKSAEPVTYDDDGNVIPLSERFNERNPDTRYSLSLDSTPEVTVEDVQAEVDRVKWGFEWTDAKLLDNLNAVRRYLIKKYPDNAISLEIDNDQKRVIVDGISRAVDFDTMPYDADFADFLRSIGVEEADIASHLTAFTPSQRKKAGKKLREGEEKAKKEAEGKAASANKKPRVYYKNEIAKTLDDILVNTVSPIIGPTSVKKKKKEELLIKLLTVANTTDFQNADLYAKMLADEIIANTVYDDFEVNADYEQMLVDGTIEAFNEINSYRGKIKTNNVKADIFAKYDKKKGQTVLRRWLSEDGVRISSVLSELQDQGYLTDVTAKSEADILIALNEEYERLKARTEMRRELLPLTATEPETFERIRNEIADEIEHYLLFGGKETAQGKLARKYRAKAAQNEADYREKLQKAQEEYHRTKQYLQNAVTNQQQKNKVALAKAKDEARVLEENYNAQIKAMKEEYRRTKQYIASMYENELAQQKEKLFAKFRERVEKLQKKSKQDLERTREIWKKRATEANYGREYAKRMNRISADVRSLRDYVNRDYTAADSMEDRQTKGIAKAFLKATTRTGVKPQAAREAARVLLSWADTAMKDNENFIGTDPLHSAMTQEELDEIRLLAASGQRQTLTDEELKNFGISREKYEAAMEAQKAKESLSLEELEEFHTALKVAIRNYRNYDRFWNGERWVDLNEKARDAVSVVQTANENFGKKGFLHRLGKGIRKIAMPFLDPLSVAAAIDGYNYSGVFQELLTKLAYAEAEKNKMIIELRKPFEEFLKEHPKYQKRLSEAIIELEDGFKITVGQALTLTELNKRDQAKTALAISRIAFRMDDGSVKKLDGFDKLPKITTPNGQTITIIRAQELIKGLRLTRDATIAELKEKGYTENTLAEFEQAVAKAEADAMPLIAQFGEQRQQMIAKIEKQLTDDDRAFIKVVSDFFQKTSKEAKTKADLRNLGYTNVIDGYYFPIKRRAADIAKDISDGTPFTDFITTVNLSFNQSIVPNAKASIDVANVWDVVTEHINGLAMWEHLYLPIQNINKIYNKNVNAGTGTTNVLSVKSLLDERTEAKYGAWLKDLLLDVQGARQRETKTFFDKGINTIRGTYAVYQLGFNPQTVVKQTLSWAAAAQYLSPASIAKGITTPRLNAKELDRVSAVAAERMGEATVVKALSNTEKISKIGEKTMWGISKMDRLVNEGLFSMCQHEVATKDPKKPIGSEDNLVEAGKLVSEVILKVQDSSDISTKSQAARSSNELIKAFTMFQSAGLKMFSRIFENVGFVMNYKHMSAEDQAKYGGKYKKAQKQLARSVGSAAAVAVLTAIIVQAFKFIYDKDREDKDGNEITVAEDLATDAATELVGFVPVVGDVVDYFVNGYEMSNFFEDTANDTLKAFSQTFALMGKVASGEVIEDWEVGSMLRKVSRAAGSLTGIPVRNVENVLSGLTRRFFPEAGYTYDTLFYRANYTEDINKALKKGDTELAGHILELMIKRGKTGGNSYSDETIEALVELHNAGYDVFPKSPDYEKLDRKSLEQFETVYQEADAAVEKLVKSEAFKAMAQYKTDESSPQASAIKTLYSGFFDLAEHDVLNEEMSRSAAYFTVTDEHNLVLVKAYDKAIKLKTVELKGSRKAMLKAYMKELGMDKTAQAYAAYSCGYRTDDITSVIFNDLKGREDEQELLIALGLIDSDEDKKEDET